MNLKDIVRQTINESVSEMHFPMSTIANETSVNLAKLHGIMRNKGYNKKSSKQSALEHHEYTKDDHWITYDGWHGSGQGNRNYGNAKLALSLYDSSNTPRYEPVADMPLNQFDSHNGSDEHINYKKNTVSSKVVSAQRDLWRNIFSHVETL